MTRQPTLFMRIHKTAGEALAKQVSDRLPPHCVCPERFEWKLRALSADDVRRYVFFQGHISPSTLSEVFKSLRVFTMLRAPRERLLSCFHYWKHGSRHARNEFFDAVAPLSLIEFLRSETPIIRRATWNVQARLIAGGQFGGVNHQRQNVFGPWLAAADLATEAIRGLDRFAFVGAAERYDLSLRRVYILMELGDPPVPERHNVTPEKPESYAELMLDPEIADALARLTEADQILFDTVISRLDRDG